MKTIRANKMKIGGYIVSFLCAMLVTLLSCVDEEVPTFPVIVFNQVEILPSAGVKFTGSIENVATNKIEDYGIVWVQKETLPNLINGTWLSLKETSNGPKKISHVVSSFRDVTAYTARIYLRTTDEVYYSEFQRFMTGNTAAPVIHLIEPEEIYFGDTLMLYGERFGNESENSKILIDNFEASVVDFSDWHAKVVIKNITSFSLSKDSLAITVVRLNALSVEKYVKLRPPVILSKTASEVYSGYDLEVFGKGLHPHFINVRWGGRSFNIKDLYINLLKITAPQIIDSATEKLVVSVLNKSAEMNLTILAPEVKNDFSDLNIGSNHTYVINGENLDNIFLNFYLDDVRLAKSVVSSEKVEIVLPEGICQKSYDLSMKLTNSEKKVLVTKMACE